MSTQRSQFKLSMWMPFSITSCMPQIETAAYHPTYSAFPSLHRRLSGYFLLLGNWWSVGSTRTQSRSWHLIGKAPKQYLKLHEQEMYCNNVFVHCSFWQLTSVYLIIIFVGLLLVLLAAIMLSFWCCKGWLEVWILCIALIVSCLLCRVFWESPVLPVLLVCVLWWPW